MVMSFDAERAQSLEEQRPRATGSGLVLAMNRSDSFRQARRHTRLVNTLKLALPALGALLCIVYAAALIGSHSLSSDLANLPIPRITPRDLSMQNPNYDGVTDDGGRYRVAAARARQDFAQSDLIQLEEIKGELVGKDKSVTTLTAVSGVFNHKENRLELEQRIEIRSDNGFSADLTRALIQTREGRIASDEPVTVRFPAGTVASKRLEIRQKAREVTFVDEVVAQLKPPSRKSGGTASGEAQNRQTPAALIGASDAPVDITSARLDIQDLDKRAIFTGNVRAVQAGSALDTPELTAFYEGGSALPGSSASAGESAGRLSRIVAKGPFIMTRENGDRVTGDEASFDAMAETGLLSGSIVMTSVPDRRVTADRVELDQRSDTAVLSGSVVVQNGETVLKGRRLEIQRTAGRTSLTAPPMAGNGPGRITARFVQKKQEAGKPEAREPAGGPNIAQFRTSPGAPLDVEADSLDVDDNARIAIFRGDVVTRQGDVTMRSQEIRASYTGSARLADPSAGADGGSSQLSRIDATGKVVVTTQDGRKITGETARYEAKANNIVVSGDVELSQAGTVVRGSRLVIDMATGKARLDTSNPKALASDGWSSEVNGRSTGGRPSAIFFPEELRKSQGAQAPKGGAAGEKPAVTAPDAGGWSSQTAPSTPQP